MAVRSIATLTVSFGLVSIPVKLYSATESSTAIRFKLMGAGGSRVRQQYVSDPVDPVDPAESETPEVTPSPVREGQVAESRGASSTVVDFPTTRTSAVAVPDREPAPAPEVISRTEMVKGYEFEKGKFVLFTSEELKALEGASRQTIDIVSFIPERSIDPIYFDKAYYLAPDKTGGKPYSLLLHAMRDTGRCALAKWAFRSKEYVVQIRAAAGGLVLQQLLYADEVRAIEQLRIEPVDVGAGELKLAKQLIEQYSADAYDAGAFVDEEKERLLAAIEQKIAGRQVVAPEAGSRAGAQVVDLMEALRASLRTGPASAATPASEPAIARERKPVRRAGAKAPAAAKSKVKRQG